MKTGLNWRKLIRQPVNGIVTQATYHGKYVYTKLYTNDLF